MCFCLEHCKERGHDTIKILLSFVGQSVIKCVICCKINFINTNKFCQCSSAKLALSIFVSFQFIPMYRPKKGKKMKFTEKNKRTCHMSYNTLLFICNFI